MINWAADRKIFFTRSRPYKKNDQATIESKNNHLVRRYGFYWRYDTPEALNLLNQLWPLVNDRLNYFTPTKKPTGYTTDKAGRRTRLYDTPRTPLDRLLDAGVLSPAQEAGLRDRRDALNPANLARRIQSLQDRLTGLARDTTLALQAATRTRTRSTVVGRTLLSGMRDPRGGRDHGSQLEADRQGCREGRQQGSSRQLQRRGKEGRWQRPVPDPQAGQVRRSAARGIRCAGRRSPIQ